MKVYVASHKYSDFLTDDLYVPLFVGTSMHSNLGRREHWAYDDQCSGSLSSKNQLYCELTGQYWIARESTDDIVGLCHYRRFFRSPVDPSRPINKYEIDAVLESHDCIVAKPFYCLHPSRSAAQSVAEQYRLTHCSTDLIQLRNVIETRHPLFLEAFDEVIVRGVCFSPFNMIICSSKTYKAYSRWLFSILKQLERRIDFNSFRDVYQQRALGFMAERLLNVYICKKKLNAFYCDVFDPNNQLDKATAELKIESRLTIDDCTHGPFIYNGIDFSKVYDPYFYLTHYEDINSIYRSDTVHAFDHFISFGLKEGRMAHPRFSIRSYINGNPLLRERFGENYLAYAEHFISENNPMHGIGFENLFSSSDAGSLGCEPGMSRFRASCLMKAETVGVLD